MKRHPYKISMFARLKQQDVLWLTPVDLSSEFGMSGRMKALLDEVTTCKRCKKKCVDVDTHFTCEGIYEDVFVDAVQVIWSTDLELLLSQEDMQRVMDGVRYEASCYAAFRRSQRLRNAGDRYTEDEVKGLFNTQQGHCYYCYEVLAEPAGFKAKFQRDHYIALSEGGGNGISNIVLACQSCNYQKHNVHGDVFVRFKMEGLSEKVQTELRKLHGDVLAWRNLTT